MKKKIRFAKTKKIKVESYKRKTPNECDK